MKENSSSIKYAANFYGGSWKNEARGLHPELTDFSEQLELDPMSLLMGVGKELGSMGKEVWQQLVWSGSSLFKSIESELQALSQSLEEQLAAIFLREKFGPSGDPIVASVFAELAQREVHSRQAAKNVGHENTRLLKRAKEQVVDRIKLAIAAELNRIEEELKQYQEAQAASQKLMAQTPEISEQMQAYEPRFRTKFHSLKAEQKRLQSLFEQIDNHFAFVDGRREGRIVFEVARQNTAPSQLKASSVAA